MNKVEFPEPEVKAYGLIRDKNGAPKIDDYKNCPNEIKAMLTIKERQTLEKRI